LYYVFKQLGTIESTFNLRQVNSMCRDLFRRIFIERYQGITHTWWGEVYKGSHPGHGISTFCWPNDLLAPFFAAIHTYERGTYQIPIYKLSRNYRAPEIVRRKTITRVVQIDIDGALDLFTWYFVFPENYDDPIFYNCDHWHWNEEEQQGECLLHRTPEDEAVDRNCQERKDWRKDRMNTNGQAEERFALHWMCQYTPFHFASGPGEDNDD
jgi:hypothetical protein